MFCLKERRSIELPEIALLERSVIVIYVFSVPISLCRRFSIATTNLLNRSVFSISVSDVDSNFSLRLEDSEPEGENDELWKAITFLCGHSLLHDVVHHYVMWFHHYVTILCSSK